MAELNKLTQEEIFAAEAYFNLATMIGKCLRVSAYQLAHPEYKPKILTSDSDNIAEDEAEEPAEPFNEDPVPISSGRINSDELSEDAQLRQLFALYNPRIREILGPSSLYEMFHLASGLFSYDLKSPDDELSDLDKKKAAVAWVIVKRTFAINHLDEALHFLNLPDVIAGDIVYNTAPVGRPMDDRDRVFIITACKLCENVVFGKIPLQQIIDNAIREIEKGKKASQSLMLPPLGALPNGEPLNWLYRITSSKNGRIVDQNKNNRHESVIVQRKGNAIRFTRKNKENGSTITLEISKADMILGKTNKTFKKTFIFILQKMNMQNNPLEVGFPLQELVDLGMYSTTSNAWRAIQDFIKQSSNIFLSGLFKKGRKNIENRANAGLLFYNASLDNGFVTISVNEKFNIDFIASQFTVFPRFAYGLKNINAFNLIQYIFYLARQNTSKIKERGTFTIGLDSVRENLGLPDPDEVKNRKYKQHIVDPIEEAISEIEGALKTVPEAKNCNFTITPVGTDTSNINQWLAGYLEIGLKGDFANEFIKRATKAETNRVRWERAKTMELAKLAAKKESEAGKKDAEQE